MTRPSTHIETPTLVGHHVGIPPALVCLFHDLGVLMEPYTVFFTQIANVWGYSDRFTQIAKALIT